MSRSLKHEFWAEFDLYQLLSNQSGENNKLLLDGFVDRGNLQSPWNKLDPATRLHLLAQLYGSQARIYFRQGNRTRIVSAKDYTRTGALQYREPSGLLYWYHGSGNQIDPGVSGPFNQFLHRQMTQFVEPLIFGNREQLPLPDLSIFPPGSWALQIIFTLKKPYISKDDVDFYIIDNPVKKEWVFKVPYVAPSQWKGALRAAMRRLKGYTAWEEESKDQQMIRLFGNVKGETEEFTKGWLHFYPTFFDRIGLEVINPHDRKTGTGKQPIYFESVPAGTPGVFTLLYVPMDEVDEETVKEDLKEVAKGIKAMLTKYGFGAKASSGYGVAEVIKNQSPILPKRWEEVFWEVWEERNV